MKDLSRRLGVVLPLFVVVIAFLYWAYVPYFGWLIACSMGIIGSIAVWEYEQLGKTKGVRQTLSTKTFIPFLIILSFYIQNVPMLPAWVFLAGIVALFALHFRQNEGAIVDLAFSVFGLLYIAIPMGMLIGILYGVPNQEGRWWVIYLLTVTKITDIGGYVCGNLFGRTKLAPSISPGKTVEGAIAGLACAVAASGLFYFLGWPQLVGSFRWLMLGLIFGIVAQFGDLAESLLKRDANKKDSNVLPGLGGALDSFDSLLFNIPILYLCLHL